MPIQIGAKGATISGVSYPAHAYIDWLTPAQEAQAVQGGDAFDVPVRGSGGGGEVIAQSRAARSSDSGGTWELLAGVTYTVGVSLPDGLIIQGPESGSAVLAVAGAATLNGTTTSITIAAGRVYTVLPRRSNPLAYLVGGVS